MLTPTQIEILTYLESELKAILVTLPSTEIKSTLATAKRSLGIAIEQALQE